MSICLLATLTACESEPEETAGPGGVLPAGVAPPLSIRTEPALRSSADAASKKLFEQGLHALRRRDFGYALDLFTDAERRQRLRVAEAPDVFVEGCVYYAGRCQEGLFHFEEAKEQYDRIPKDSRYRPYAAQRLVTLGRDSDGDGYADAWEEAEGKNPLNPLSHP